MTMNFQLLNVGRVAAGKLPTTIKQRHAVIGWGLIDPDYTYRVVNQTLAEMNGVPPENHHGRTVDDVLPKETASLIKDHLNRARKGISVIDIGLVWTDAKGRNHESIITYTPDYAVAGRFLGWTVIVRPAGSVEKWKEPSDTGIHSLERIQRELAAFRRKRPTSDRVESESPEHDPHPSD